MLSAFGTFRERIGRSRLIAERGHSWAGAATAVALAGAGALILDAVTPQVISVGIFYVALVLIGFWFPNPKAAPILALLATPLIIFGYWITIPDNTPAWEAWLNRALAIGTVWMVAVFVWHICVVEQKLQAQIELSNSLSREVEHRVGNHLQLVAAFLRLQAANSSEQTRHALELAGARVMAIGNIQRMLSHSTPSGRLTQRSSSPQLSPSCVQRCLTPRRLTSPFILIPPAALDEGGHARRLGDILSGRHAGFARREFHYLKRQVHNRVQG